jgi:sulfonate transport system permease protein
MPTTFSRVPSAISAAAAAVAAGFRRSRRLALQLLFPVGLLLAWELATRYGLVEDLFLPRPEKVVLAFTQLLQDEFLTDLSASTVLVLKGFSAGALAGLILGFSSGISRTVEDLFGPTLNAIRQVPPLAWLPLIVLWFGAGDGAKTLLIAKTVFFPVFLNTLQAIRGTSREHIEVGRIFAYGRWRILWHIVLPAALPGIFVGLRYGAGIAWAVLIIAEMLGARRGLGYILIRSQEFMRSDHLLFVIVLIGLIGFSIDTALRRLESHLLRWKRGFEG